MARPLQHLTLMNRGMHWGALLFTLAVAAAALPLLSGTLLAPLAAHRPGMTRSDLGR